MAVHALAQLIEDIQDMSDPRLSLNLIAKRSGLSSSRIHQLVRQDMKTMPDPDTLRALARALRLPLRVVVDAALTSLGLPAPEPPAIGTIEQMRQIVRRSSVLSPELRATWMAMIDAMEQEWNRRGDRRFERGPVPVDVDEALEDALVGSRSQLDLAGRREALEKASKLLDDPSLSDEERGWLRDRIREQRLVLDAATPTGEEHQAL